ncbi:MAG: hypothetical protein R3F60_04845 [bacterium]
MLPREEAAAPPVLWADEASDQPSAPDGDLLAGLFSEPPPAIQAEAPAPAPESDPEAAEATESTAAQSAAAEAAAEAAEIGIEAGQAGESARSPEALASPDDLLAGLFSEPPASAAPPPDEAPAPGSPEDGAFDLLDGLFSEAPPAVPAEEGTSPPAEPVPLSDPAPPTPPEDAPSWDDADADDAWGEAPSAMPLPLERPDPDAASLSEPPGLVAPSLFTEPPGQAPALDLGGLDGLDEPLLFSEPPAVAEAPLHFGDPVSAAPPPAASPGAPPALFGADLFGSVELTPAPGAEEPLAPAVEELPADPFSRWDALDSLSVVPGDSLEVSGAPPAADATSVADDDADDADDAAAPAADADPGTDADEADDADDDSLDLDALAGFDDLYDDGLEATSFEPDEATDAGGSTAPPRHREEPFSTRPPIVRSLSSEEVPDRPSRPLAALALLRSRSSGSEALTAAEARARIASSPVDLEAWRSLRERMADTPACSRWLADVFAWVDGRILGGPVVRPTLTLPDELIDALIPPEVPPSLVVLLRRVALPVRLALADLQKAQPPAASPVETENLAHDVAERVATVLGAASFRMGVDDERPYQVTIVPAATPTLVFGRALLDDTTSAGLTFLLARTLVPVVEGTLPARLLPEREFGPFLVALLLALGADLGVHATPVLLERARAVLTPALEGADGLLRVLAGDCVADLRGADLRGVRRGLEVYADRLALALSDGFGGAMEMLRRLAFDDRPRSELDSDDLIRFLRDNSAAAELVAFAGDDTCLAIRKWLLHESADD